MSTDSSLPLDELDRRILRTLQHDSSLNNEALARRVHASAPTTLRRVRRLKAVGVITGEVALVAPGAFGPSLTAILEITLDRQGESELAAFASRVDQEPAVLQSYRVSAGPDFVLVAQVTTMDEYQAFARRTLGPGSNVRNVRAYFAIERTKFRTGIPIPALGTGIDTAASGRLTPPAG